MHLRRIFGNLRGLRAHVSGKQKTAKCGQTSEPTRRLASDTMATSGTWTMCPVCKRSFRGAAGLKIHTAKSKGYLVKTTEGSPQQTTENNTPRKKDNEAPRTEDNAVVYRCEHCSLDFSSRAGLSNHSRSSICAVNGARLWIPDETLLMAKEELQLRHSYRGTKMDEALNIRIKQFAIADLRVLRTRKIYKETIETLRAARTSARETTEAIPRTPVEQGAETYGVFTATGGAGTSVGRDEIQLVTTKLVIPKLVTSNSVTSELVTPHIQMLMTRQPVRRTAWVMIRTVTVVVATRAWIVGNPSLRRQVWECTVAPTTRASFMQKRWLSWRAGRAR